jgi:hypothetical protein
MRVLMMDMKKNIRWTEAILIKPKKPTTTTFQIYLQFHLLLPYIVLTTIR